MYRNLLLSFLFISTQLLKLNECQNKKPNEYNLDSSYYADENNGLDDSLNEDYEHDDEYDNLESIGTSNANGNLSQIDSKQQKNVLLNEKISKNTSNMTLSSTSSTKSEADVFDYAYDDQEVGNNDADDYYNSVNGFDDVIKPINTTTRVRTTNTTAIIKTTTTATTTTTTTTATTTTSTTDTTKIKSAKTTLTTTTTKTTMPTTTTTTSVAPLTTSLETLNKELTNFKNNFDTNLNEDESIDNEDNSVDENAEYYEEEDYDNNEDYDEQPDYELLNDTLIDVNEYDKILKEEAKKSTTDVLEVLSTTTILTTTTQIDPIVINKDTEAEQLDEYSENYDDDDDGGDDDDNDDPNDDFYPEDDDNLEDNDANENQLLDIEDIDNRINDKTDGILKNNNDQGDLSDVDGDEIDTNKIDSNNRENKQLESIRNRIDATYLNSKPKSANFSMRELIKSPALLAGILGGLLVGIVTALLIIFIIVYRMRKKDEGTYVIAQNNEGSFNYAYMKAPTKEFYA